VISRKRQLRRSISLELSAQAEGAAEALFSISLTLFLTAYRTKLSCNVHFSPVGFEAGRSPFSLQLAAMRTTSI
jgi:hypothetical protein